MIMIAIGNTIWMRGEMTSLRQPVAVVLSPVGGNCAISIHFKQHRHHYDDVSFCPNQRQSRPQIGKDQCLLHLAFWPHCSWGFQSTPPSQILRQIVQFFSHFLAFFKFFPAFAKLLMQSFIFNVKIYPPFSLNINIPLIKRSVNICIVLELFHDKYFVIIFAIIFQLISKLYSLIQTSPLQHPSAYL